EMVEKFLTKIKNPTVISGGSAANTAVGYSSLGGNAYFIGQIGNDKYGDLFARNINKSGVFFEKKGTSLKDQTSKSIILVTPDAERSMNTFLGASINFNANSVNEPLILKSNYIYIEGYLFDQTEAKKAIYDCCKLARANNCKVALSLSDQFCVDRHRQDFNNLIKQYVDIIFANESEIKSLYQNDLEGCLREILKNVETGAITLGSKGSIVFKDHDSFSIDPIKVTKLVDTTGAGDLYASGFLYGYVNNKSIKECGDIGSKAAAEIITHYGARPKTSLEKILK
ncbi:adenosine kinase, partial [Alphaproteobacteria bacterium]|nr:adenosine kinase [Alphaproteobacteria bacterium]